MHAFYAVVAAGLVGYIAYTVYTGKGKTSPASTIGTSSCTSCWHCKSCSASCICPKLVTGTKLTGERFGQYTTNKCFFALHLADQEKESSSTEQPYSGPWKDGNSVTSKS